MIRCPDCDTIVVLSMPERGNGRCRHCHGRGTVSVPILGEKAPCPFCHGTAQCQRCGGSGRVQGPPKVLEPAKRPPEPESPPPPRSEIVQEWYRICDESKFIPPSIAKAYDEELKAIERRLAIDVGLEHFTEYTCRQCGDTGYFKVHFLGRIVHPSCGWKAYLSPGSYIGYQTSRVFRVGADVASEKDGSAGSVVFGFILGSVFRAVVALFLIPLQMIVGLLQAKQPRSEFVTRIVVLSVFGITLIVFAYRSHERPSAPTTRSAIALQPAVPLPASPTPTSAPEPITPPTPEPTPVVDTAPTPTLPPPSAVPVPEQNANAAPVSPNPPPPSDTQEPPRFYRIGNGVSAPTVARSVEPQYAEEARRAKWQGTVVVSVIVTEQGLPEELKVTRSLGMGLDEKAIEAVKQWRFNPGRKDGKPVPVLATIEVNFRLL